MALPSTNITLNDVNLQLNNSSGTTITLNDSRVRSLGGNLGASGTATNMTGLAGKSATWVCSTDVSRGFFRAATGGAGIALASTNGTFVGEYMFVPLNDAGTVFQWQFRKYYLNGQVAQLLAWSDSSATSSGFVGMGFGPSDTSPLYVCNNNIFTSLNITTGAVGAQKSYAYGGNAAGYNYGYPMAVDSAGNLYCGFSFPIGSAQSYCLMSLDSALNFRWAKWTGAYNSSNTAVALSCHVDTADNIWVGYSRTYTGNAWTNSAGVMKLNSAGTVLYDNVFTNYTGTGGSELAYYPINVRTTSAGWAVGTTQIGVSTTNVTWINYYNSANTLQWVRQLSDPAGYEVQGGHVVTDSVGNTYALLGGRIAGTPTYKWIFHFLKFNSAGTLQWQRRFRSTSSNGTVDAVFAPYSANGSVAFQGLNDCLVTVSLYAGVMGEYFPTANPFVLTLKADGSGTGTYTFPVATGVTQDMIYEVSSQVAVAAGSQTAATLATWSPITMTGTAASTVTTTTPDSSMIYTRNNI